MGCFWGTEAMLGAAKGVVLTRVGFAGGSSPEPSYTSQGNHAETVEVAYDPQRTSYKELLKHFWKHHNPHAKPVFDSSASAIFIADSQDKKVAEMAKSEWLAAHPNTSLSSSIREIKQFYPARTEQQKHYLQQDPILLESLPQYDEILHTPLATKLNSVSGRGGERQALSQSLSGFGISSEAQKILFQRAVWPERNQDISKSSN